MGRLLPSHWNAQHRIPPYDALMELVDRNCEGGHWLWGGDFLDDDDLRCAIFKYDHGRYIVARALWEHHTHIVPFKRRFRNNCGVTTCVNPAHHSIDPLASEQGPYTLPWPYVLSDGTRATVVRVHAGTTHILVEDMPWFVCVAKRHGSTELAVGRAITCKECVARWKQAGRGLVVLDLEDN